MASKFLLDANLSPKTARYLASTFGFDVVSLIIERLEQIPDHEVIAMARSADRVIITLDEDFERPDVAGGPLPGIIYLDLPNTHRYIPAINAILDRFFRTQAQGIDLERALITITEESVIILL